VRANLLRDTALRRNGCGLVGRLVLRAGRRRGGHLTPLECLVEAVELRKKAFAVAVFLGGCVLRLRVCARVGRSTAACAQAVFLGGCVLRLRVCARVGRSTAACADGGGGCAAAG
jgi:uncharacterized ParB-like nuclease family protein